MEHVGEDDNDPPPTYKRVIIRGARFSVTGAGPRDVCPLAKASQGVSRHLDDIKARTSRMGEDDGIAGVARPASGLREDEGARHRTGLASAARLQFGIRLEPNSPNCRTALTPQLDTAAGLNYSGVLSCKRIEWVGEAGQNDSGPPAQSA
jgi:hypothetical protein